MRVNYYFKNIKVNKLVFDFIEKELEKILRLEPKINEGLVEFEFKKDKESQDKKGLYKFKASFDVPGRELLVIKTNGRNIMEAVSLCFKKAFLLLKSQSGIS